MAEQSERRWVWFSTPASVEAGKTSVLAVIETLVAIALTISLAIYFKTLTYIAITACIAPFLLLRTPESTQMGVEWFTRYEDFITISFIYVNQDILDFFSKGPTIYFYYLTRLNFY